MAILEVGLYTGYQAMAEDLDEVMLFCITDEELFSFIYNGVFVCMGKLTTSCGFSG